MTKYFYNLKHISICPAVFKWIQKIIIAISVITITAVFTSCEEDPATIGSGLFPGSDFVTVTSTDTLSVFGYSSYDTRVRTDGSYYSYLGNLSDPFFGDTEADLVAQLRLDTAWGGGGPVTVDSVKFFMALLPSEGSVLTNQYLSLYEATDYLSVDSAYYSDKTVHKGLNFGSYLIPELKEDTGTTVVITLPNSIGEYLMRDTTKLFHSNDEPDFRSFFKGLYISLQDSPDPIFLTTYLLSASPTAGILVYYQNKRGTGLVFPFIISDKSVIYNRYIRDFTKASPDKRILHLNERVRDSVTYLQNYEGVFTRIEMPGLKGIKAMMPIAVNRTRLKIPVYFDADSLFKPDELPTQVMARYISSDGSRDTIPDFMISSTFMGGTYDSDSSQYVFNISAFTQLYLDGLVPEPVIELYLPAGTSKNLIFKMNGNTRSPKLEFTYTKF